MSDKASFLKYINEVGGSDDESESPHESSIQDIYPLTTTAQSTESGISYDSLSTAGHEHAFETKEEEEFASHEMMNEETEQIQSGKDSNLKKSLEGNDLKINQQQEDDQVMTTIASSVTETSSNNNQKQQQMLQSPPRTRIKSILHTPPATPSPSKSSLHKNNSTPSSIKRVRMSPLIKTTPTKRAMTTPPRINKPSSNSSPESSKRPKIISPFSPRARKLRLKHSNNTPVTTSSLQWSMKPSRKVSILVNVMPHLQSHLYNEEETTLCLYPNSAPDEVIVEGDKMTFSPARSVKSSYSVTSTSSILNKATPAQEVLLVNPDIFGDIPTSITLETARMVQYFSNKSSEDWVRKFKFDEVCWPDVRQLIGIKWCEYFYKLTKKISKSQSTTSMCGMYRKEYKNKI
ncbi:hypothetical protein CTEN210_00028 [Chaetoceros tenuissimus]|uniref:Uncharacterized protein n=1 Tax=Chaetoceros tenuissimus TaxID=426638 RepID=A0AAD3CEE6_9STRA|nr:hypothetical protein CTEN210_00028 [Chaetoceros tenuissimus]